MQQCSSVPVVQWRLLCRDCRGWCSAQCPPRRHTKGTHGSTLLHIVTESKLNNQRRKFQEWSSREGTRKKSVENSVLFVTFRL